MKFRLFPSAIVSSFVFAAVPSAYADDSGDEAGPGPAARMSHRVSAESSDFEHATGFIIQGRLQSNAGLLSLGLSPGFMAGYQGRSFAVGLGLSAMRLSLSESKDDEASLSIFEVMPTAIFDVWKSADGRARANIVGSVGYARGSVTGTSSSTSCTGTGPCTTTHEKNTGSATLVPFFVGFGGDYYLSRNFALGVEVGLQALLLGSVSEDTKGKTTNPDVSGNFQMTYGLLRATVLLGD